MVVLTLVQHQHMVLAVEAVLALLDLMVLLYLVVMVALEYAPP
jgi:hypothetical protein